MTGERHPPAASDWRGCPHRPAERPGTTARAFEEASGVAAEHGLPTPTVVVIADANDVLVHLRPAPVVARVATTAAIFNDPEERLARARAGGVPASWPTVALRSSLRVASCRRDPIGSTLTAQRSMPASSSVSPTLERSTQPYGGRGRARRERHRAERAEFWLDWWRERLA